MTNTMTTLSVVPAGRLRKAASMEPSGFRHVDQYDFSLFEVPVREMHKVRETYRMLRERGFSAWDARRLIRSMMDVGYLAARDQRGLPTKFTLAPLKNQEVN